MRAELKHLLELIPSRYTVKMTQSKIIVTGFTPFPGAPENPTQVLIEAMQAGKIEMPKGVDVLPLQLEAAYEDALAVLAGTWRVEKPDAVISFGLSAKANGFTLETVARNEVTSTLPDNAGRRTDSNLIDSDGEAFLPSTLPLMDIHRSLREADLPIEFSDNAGGYVCNWIFYLGAAKVLSDGQGCSGFVHVPYLDTQYERLMASGEIDPAGKPMSEAQLFGGVEIILNTVAGALRSGLSPTSV